MQWQFTLSALNFIFELSRSLTQTHRCRMYLDNDFYCSTNINTESLLFSFFFSIDKQLKNNLSQNHRQHFTKCLKCCCSKRFIRSPAGFCSFFWANPDTRWTIMPLYASLLTKSCANSTNTSQTQTAWPSFIDEDPNTAYNNFIDEYFENLQCLLPFKDH